jgi:hypothetical protein
MPDIPTRNNPPQNSGPTPVEPGSPMSEIPTGPERTVRLIGGTAIDGAPIAYIIALAAVVAALAMIPLSVIIGGSGSFPLSQAIYGLLGWILGPIAGAIANGIGSLVGIVIAAYTAGPIPWLRVYSAVLGSFAAGTMFALPQRKIWWIPAAIWATLSLALYIGHATLTNGISWQVVLPGTMVDWSATVLFILPTRNLVVRWIKSDNKLLTFIGLFLGTWIVYGLSHVFTSAILNLTSNMPVNVWLTITPLIPLEMLVRCTVGALIGTGVIAGMRAIHLPTPSKGIL